MLQAFKDGDIVDACIFITQTDLSSYISSIRDIDKSTLLHLACQWNWGQWGDVTKQLVEMHNCNILAQNDDGDTPLHMVARFNNADAAHYLLSLKSCDPSIRNNDNSTVLCIAIDKQHDGVVRELVYSGKVDDEIMEHQLFQNPDGIFINLARCYVFILMFQTFTTTKEIKWKLAHH